MKTKVIEASQNIKTGFNWGKFLVAAFDHEWAVETAIGSGSLLRACGWSPNHILVMDLQTGEGAIFKPGGLPHADLEKHQVWVCVLFEDFLEWLYKQDLTDLDTLPANVELPDASIGMVGYRRQGMCQVHEIAYRSGRNGPFCEGCCRAGLSAIGAEVTQ